MADPRKWKSVERLVAAIHKLADEGAEVNWNETLDGRQFDVTVRFVKGLYRYMTVIECKDYSGPAPVGDVAAFVTKSRDAKADRAVIASSVGFQSGVRDFAVHYNITLFRVLESEDIDRLLRIKGWYGESGRPAAGAPIDYSERHVKEILNNL